MWLTTARLLAPPLRHSTAKGTNLLSMCLQFNSADKIYFDPIRKKHYLETIPTDLIFWFFVGIF